MHMIILQTNLLIKMPRNPPGPQYYCKDKNGQTTELDKKYMLIVLHNDNNPVQNPMLFQSKTNEALHLLQKLTKPETLNLDLDGDGGPNNAGLFLTEDQIIKEHVKSLERKYLDFLKETEYQYKQNVKELKELQVQGLIQGTAGLQQMSTHLYKIKQVLTMK